MAKEKSQCATLKHSSPPSPPAEKATARQDQAGKASTGDGRGHRRWVEQGRLDERADVSLRRTGVTREREHLGDLERRTREDTRQRHAVGSVSLKTSWPITVPPPTNGPQNGFGVLHTRTCDVTV